MQEINLETIEQAMKASLFKPWLVWATSATFVLFQFFLQLSSGVIVEDLMQSFTINALEAGILSSTYYYIYVTLQTPAGMLVDRYGPRKLLAGGAIVCAFGCWLFATTAHLALAEIGRLLMGAGSSFAFVGSLYLISQWFAAQRFAFMVGVAETIGTVGTLFGNIFLAEALTKHGWRVCMLGASLVAILIGLGCWLIIRDRPAHSQQEISRVADGHFFQHVLTLIKNPVAWFNGIYSGLLFSVVTVFVALWGIPFLVKAHQISVTLATVVSSCLFLGLALGCPLVGAFCHHVLIRKKLMVYCAFASALLLTTILLITSLPLVLVASLMFVLGLLCSSYVINFAIAKEIAPKQATSTSIGFTNMLSVITAPLMQPAVGALLHWVHNLGGAPDAKYDAYTLLDYQIALLILPIGLIAAAFIALAMPVGELLSEEALVDKKI